MCKNVRFVRFFKIACVMTGVIRQIKSCPFEQSLMKYDYRMEGLYYSAQDRFFHSTHSNHCILVFDWPLPGQKLKKNEPVVNCI